MRPVMHQVVLLAVRPVTLQVMLQVILQVVLQVVIFPAPKTSKKARALLHTARTLLLPARRLPVLSNTM